MPSTRWSRPVRSRASPPRSTKSQRRAFRSSPLPRGRCCSNTRVSNRDRRSWCAVRQAASAPARRRWRRRPVSASTELRAPGTSNGSGAGCRAGRGKRWRRCTVGLPAPRCGYRHHRRQRTRKHLRGIAPERDHRFGGARARRGLCPVARHASGVFHRRRHARPTRQDLGNRPTRNAKPARRRGSRPSQTRRSLTACWMARPTSPERSCSRSQTDRGGGNRGCGKVRCRRISPVAPRPREGPMNEPTADAHLGGGNASSMPQSSHRGRSWSARVRKRR